MSEAVSDLTQLIDQKAPVTEGDSEFVPIESSPQATRVMLEWHLSLLLENAHSPEEKASIEAELLKVRTANERDIQALADSFFPRKQQPTPQLEEEIDEIDDEIDEISDLRAQIALLRLNAASTSGKDDHYSRPAPTREMFEWELQLMIEHTDDITEKDALNAQLSLIRQADDRDLPVLFGNIYNRQSPVDTQSPLDIDSLEKELAAMAEEI